MPDVVVSRSTDLPIPAERACRLAQSVAMFRFVVRPIFGIRDAPDSLREGETLSARLYWLLVIPSWTHHLELVSVGPTEIRTREHGGMVKRWNHRLTFEPTSATTCRYTDEVTLNAGAMTPSVRAFAHFMYRWRQRRWRRVTAILADEARRAA